MTQLRSVWFGLDLELRTVVEALNKKREADTRLSQSAMTRSFNLDTEIDEAGEGVYYFFRCRFEHVPTGIEPDLVTGTRPLPKQAQIRGN